MIQRVSLDSAAALDDFVEKNGSFLQSSLWGRVKSDWNWFGLVCRDAKGEIRGTMALLEHRLHRLNRCLLYAPRGPVALDAASAAELLAAARALGKERKAYLLRIDPEIEETDREKVEWLRGNGFRLKTATDFSLFQARYNYVLNLYGETPESLLRRYHPSARRNVRLAEQNGLEVYHGSVLDLPDFCRMMAQTAEKNGFCARSKQYFHDILTQMPNNATLYLAAHEGRTIAATIMVRFGETASFFYGCSDGAYLHLHPNELLQYKMQCDAIESGCKQFDLRGVEGEPIETNPKFGLHSYKMRFGATLVRYAGEFDMILNHATDALVKIVGISLRFKNLRGKAAPHRAIAACNRLWKRLRLPESAPSGIPSRH